MYDPSQLETIHGRVLKIERVGPGQGTWLQVKTEQETLTVHLGPAWYLNQQKVAIAPNETIEVTGVRNIGGNDITLMASKFKYTGQTIELYDKQGFPSWGQ